MEKIKRFGSIHQKITVFILIVLSVINALWVLLSDFSGPLIGFIFYSVIALLCWRKKDYQAAVFAGIFGFAVHLYELIFFKTVNTEDFLTIFLYLNLLLPLPLLYFGCRAKKMLKIMKE